MPLYNLDDMKIHIGIKGFLLFAISISMFVFLSCDLGDNEDSGYVNYKILIESNLDSVSVLFSDPQTLDILKTTIRNFPWTFDYSDAYNSYGIWHLNSKNDNGFIKITFYNSDSNNKNLLKFRDSVTYYAPFTQLNFRCGADEQINYNFNIASSDSINFKLGFDAWWSDYDIDTITINDWHLYEFQTLYHKYKGSVINLGNSNNSTFSFASSGKSGRVSKTFSISALDTIRFQVSQGQINILE